MPTPLNNSQIMRYIAGYDNGCELDHLHLELGVPRWRLEFLIRRGALVISHEQSNDDPELHEIVRVA